MNNNGVFYCGPPKKETEITASLAAEQHFPGQRRFTYLLSSIGALTNIWPKNLQVAERQRVDFPRSPEYHQEAAASRFPLMNTFLPKKSDSFLNRTVLGGPKQNRIYRKRWKQDRTQWTGAGATLLTVPSLCVCVCVCVCVLLTPTPRQADCYDNKDNNNISYVFSVLYFIMTNYDFTDMENLLLNWYTPWMHLVPWLRHSVVCVPRVGGS